MTIAPERLESVQREILAELRETRKEYERLSRDFWSCVCNYWRLRRLVRQTRAFEISARFLDEVRSVMGGIVSTERLWRSCRTDPLPNEVGDRILVLWWRRDHWNADRRRMSICELTENHGWRDEEGDILCPEEEGEFWASEQDITGIMQEGSE